MGCGKSKIFASPVLFLLFLFFLLLFSVIILFLNEINDDDDDEKHMAVNTDIVLYLNIVVQK